MQDLALQKAILQIASAAQRRIRPTVPQAFLVSAKPRKHAVHWRPEGKKEMLENLKWERDTSPTRSCSPLAPERETVLSGTRRSKGKGGLG